MRLQRNKKVWTTQEKKQSVETVLEEDYMLDLLDKDFK